MNIDSPLQQEIINLTALIKTVPSSIYWKDRQSIYRGCSDFALRTLGLNSENDILGKTDFELPWREIAPHIKLLNDEVIETLASIETEALFTLPNGKKITLLVRQSPLLDKKNNVIGLIGNWTDITFQKNIEVVLQKTEQKTQLDMMKVEKRIQATIDTIAGNHWWKDKEGRYLGCNKVAANAWGLESPDEVIGKTDYELPWANTATALIAHDKEVMETGKTVKREEMVATKEGKPLIFLVTKTPLRDSDGSIIGTIGTSVDITEMKEMQRSLKVAKEQAELSDRLKTEFIRNMEHDFRTPFSGIWGIANLLEHAEEDETKKEYFTDIKTCAKELLDYFTDILSYSKIEKGFFPVTDKKFNLANLIDKIIVVEKLAAKNKQLEISAHLDQKLPKVLIGDSYRFYQILINLMSNAIKFTEEGHVKLLARLINPVEDKTIIVRFTVEDTGVGIPQDKIDDLYDRFNRLNPSNQGIYKGMGLGLKIVRQLVDELGGEIDVQSHPGKGTQFHCSFPFKLPLTDDFANE